MFQARAILSQFDKNLYYDDCPAEDKKNNQRLANNNGSPDNTINNIVVYPNPANNELKVYLVVEDSQEAVIFIYNLMGELVNAKNLVNGVNSMNTTELANGTYLYTIKINEGNVKNGKLLIMK